MATETLRPTGAGDETNISSVTGAATHWEAVDEAIADDATTTVQHNTDSTSARDLYTLANSSVGAGTINKITVYIRGEGTSAWFKSAIKEGGTVTESAQFTSSGDDTFETKSTDYTTNPRTGSAWQWSEIDSLQVGCVSYRDPAQQGRITQVYVVVDYTVTGPTYTLAMGTGTYDLTGKTNNLLKSSLLVMGTGAYTLTGKSVNLLKLFIMTMGTGAYSLTGNSISFFVKVWTKITKNIASWTNSNKNSSSWSNRNKNNSNWTNQNKN